MAEDSDLERSEPASPKRLEEAREKGNVPRSRELSTFAVLMASGAALVMSGPQLAAGLAQQLRQLLQFDHALIEKPELLWPRLIQAILDALWLFLPMMLALLVVVLAVPVLMGGWLFSAESLQPDPSRLSPLKGFGRMFSVTSLVELGKALAKSLVVGSVGYWVVWHHREEMLALATQPLELGIAYVGSLLASAFVVITAAMIVIVAIDVPYQLWDYHRKLRMTKEEVRQEARESEGDPQLKARIRTLQRETARRRMMAEVPKADVIVTNPTHYAVALRYQEREMRAPRVVAKGAYLLAERIRELGVEHGVPILTTPPLARALYHHAEINQEIPAALFTAVAEVLAYVYQLRGYNARGGVMPQPPANLPVPEGMDQEEDTE